jgi:hypothetical protein
MKFRDEEFDAYVTEGVLVEVWRDDHVSAAQQFGVDWDGPSRSIMHAATFETPTPRGVAAHTPEAPYRSTGRSPACQGEPQVVPREEEFDVFVIEGVLAEVRRGERVSMAQQLGEAWDGPVHSVCHAEVPCPPPDALALPASDPLPWMPVADAHVACPEAALLCVARVELLHAVRLARVLSRSVGVARSPGLAWVTWLLVVVTASQRGHVGRRTSTGPIQGCAVRG